MRPIVLNRKNALFAGHDQGAENWAAIASLVETCKLHGVDPQAYFADVLTKLVNLWPASCAFRRSRPLIPTDHDHLFRSIATSVARMLIAPLDDGGDVSLLWVGQARREAVPVVNRRD